MAEHDPLAEAKRILASAGQAYLEFTQRTPLFAAMGAFVDENITTIVEGISNIGAGAQRQQQFAAIEWETTNALTLAQQIVDNVHLFAVPELEAPPPVAEVHEQSGEATSPQPERNQPMAETKLEWPGAELIEDFFAAQDELHALLAQGGILDSSKRGLRRKLRRADIQDRKNNWTVAVLQARLDDMDDETDRIRPLIKKSATTTEESATKYGETIPRSNRMRLLTAQQALATACHDRDINDHPLLQTLVREDQIRVTTADWPSVADIDRYTEDLLEAAKQLPAKKIEPEAAVNDDPVQDRTWQYLTITLLPQLTTLAADYLNGQHHLLTFETTAAARANAREQDVLTYIRQVEAAITPLRERARTTEDRVRVINEHQEDKSDAPANEGLGTHFLRSMTDKSGSLKTPVLIGGLVIVVVLLSIVAFTMLPSGSGSTDALEQIRSLSK